MESDRATTTTAFDSRRRCLLGLLAIVLLIALPIRLYLSATAAMLSRDGATFIWYAQGLAENPVAEMRRRAQHPLYPAAVLASHGVARALQPFVAGDLLDDPVRRWEVAARAVTLIGGLAVVAAMYAVTTVVFDRRVGLVAAALAATAAEFCQLSADALSDMPHLAMYLFAMAAAVRGIRDRRQAWLFVAGVLTGAGFLIRPEGAEVGVAAVVVLGLFAKDWPYRRRLVGAITLALGAGLVASPYMLVTGRLVQKKSIGRFFAGEDESARVDEIDPAKVATCHKTFAARAEARGSLARGSLLRASRFAEDAPTVGDERAVPAGVSDLGRALGRIGENWFRSLRVTFLLPAIVWLIRRQDVRGDPCGLRLIAAAGLVHLLILVALLIRFDYWDPFSLRHVMVLAGLTLPFSAAGVVAILGAVPAQRRGVVALILAAVMIGPTLPWLLETRYAHRAHLRRAGEWIRAHSEGTPRIQTTRNRVAFYANGIYVRSPLEKDVARILTEARFQKPDWLVFDERRMLKASVSFFDDLERAVLPGESLERSHVETEPATRGTNRAIVYRYRAESKESETPDGPG